MAIVYKWYYDHIDEDRGITLITHTLQEPDTEEHWILVKCEKYENGGLFLMYDPFRNINYLKDRFH